MNTFVFLNANTRALPLLILMIFSSYLTAAPKVGSCTIGAQSPLVVISGNSCTYLVTVNRGSGGGSGGGFTANLTVSTSLPSGITASFTSTSLTFGGPTNSASTTLTFAIAATVASGSYPFKVRALTGTADSAVASGTIQVCRVLEANPVSASVCEGGLAVFSVVASGNSISYQWRRNGVNLLNGGSIAGATSDQLTVSPADAIYAGNYDVVVTNSCGTATSAPAILTIQTAPQVNCSGNAVVPAPANQCGALVSFSAVATGQPTPTITYSQASGSLFSVGDHSITATAVNTCGTSTCEINVKVVDVTPPVAICKNATLTLDTNGSATLTPAMIDSASYDACGIIEASVSLSDFGCDDVGTHAVVLYISDPNGNISSCTSMVTVVAPAQVLCKSTTANLDQNGQASITAQDVDDGSFSVCGISALSVSPSSFSCIDAGSQQVILTMVDNSGATSTCQASVNILSSATPVAVCKNAELPLGTSGSASVTPAIIDNGSFISCGTFSLNVYPTTFDCSQLGVQSVELTIEDALGNTATCSSLVTVVDTVAPSATCKTHTVYLDANGQASITAQDIDNGSIDVCGGSLQLYVTPSTFDCSYIGTNTATLTAVDVSGNSSTCVSTVHVQGSVQAICKDIQVYLDPNGQATIQPAELNNGSIATCGLSGMSLSTQFFSCANFGLNPVTLTVTATDGQTSTCTSMVTISDTISPQVVTQNIQVVLGSTGSVSVSAPQVNNGSLDACGISSVHLSKTSFSCSDLGTDTVTLTVTDIHGNSAVGTSVITVVDQTDPIALCKPVNANVSITLDANGQATLQATAIDNGSNDACGIASYTVSPQQFDCSTIGNKTVTLMVADASGNTSSCTSIVRVKDQTDPIAICKPATVMLDANGSVTIGALQIDNGSSDVCGITNRAVTPNSFDCSNLGDNQVILTVTDLSGNTASCSAIVTVVDLEEPAFAPKSDITVEYDPAFCGAAVEYSMLATDNCAATIVQNTGLPSGSVFPFGSTLNTFTATDISGNSISASFAVHVTPAIRQLELVSSSTECQYSDTVSLQAIIAGGASLCNGPDAAQSADFYIGSYLLGTADFVASGPDLVAILSPAVMRANGADNHYFAPGSKVLSVTISGTTPEFTINTQASISFLITRENATTVYTGLNYYTTASANNATATVTLLASVLDISAAADHSSTDSLPGDIRYATVSFVNRDNGNIIASNLPITLISQGDERIGMVQYSWIVNIGQANSVTYTIGVIVDGYYAADNVNENSLVTVSKPLNDFISGGGYIILSNPGGSKSADIGTKNHFGFNVKYNRRNTNLIGSINCIIRKTEADGLLHTYQIKGNNLQSLSVNIQAGKAQLSGKASVQDITDPLNPVSLFGNATFQLKASDLGDPGNLDSISIVLYHPQNGLWYASNWTGINGIEQVLDNGNIRINNSSSARYFVEVTDSKSEDVVSDILMECYPNPAYQFTNIEFELISDSHVEWQLMELSGRMLRSEHLGQIQAATPYRVELDLGTLTAGHYLIRLVADGQSVTRKLIVFK